MNTEDKITLESFFKQSSLHREHYMINVFGMNNVKLALNVLMLDCVINKQNVNFRIGLDKDQEFMVNVDESFDDTINVVFTYDLDDLLTIFRADIFNPKIIIHEHFKRHGKEGFTENAALENLIKMLRRLPFTGLIVLTSDLSFRGLVDFHLQFKIHDDKDTVMYLQKPSEEFSEDLGFDVYCMRDFYTRESTSFKDFDKDLLVDEIEAKIDSQRRKYILSKQNNRGK